MELKIYSQVGTLRASISPSDSSTHQKGIMQDNVLTLSFILYDFVRLEVNDYVDFSGERFTLLNEYRPQQKSTVEYQYDVRFYGIESELKKALVLKMVDGDNDPSFALNDSPRVHLQLIADNINRIKGTQNWTIGQIIVAPNQNVEYDCTYCYDALNKLAEAFGTEWWIEGNTINLSRCEHGDLLKLGYGYGLTTLSKEENETAPFFTRLYPIGSTRNIEKDKYGSARLHLPAGAQYVEQNAHLGIVEYAEEAAFSGIYPRRVGTVGSVRMEVRKIEGIERTIYYFTDPGLIFDPNDYEIAGLVKHVQFQSGSLNGNDFEVNFDSAKKEFEIINQYPYENLQLPGGTMIPKSGNEYVLYNLRMPDEYYGLAEQELKQAVDEYLQKFSIDMAVYKAPTDYIDIDERGIVLNLGRRVRLLSDEYFTGGYRESRITAISRKVNNPSEADIECSYAVSPGRVAYLENNVTEIQAAIKEQVSKELQVLKSYDSADPTDYNVFSSIRARRESLSRRFPDTAAETITFKKGVISNGFSTEEFASGPTGIGGRIDPDGNGELHSLVLRMFLETPELRKNKISVIGDEFWVTAAGLIESVRKVSALPVKTSSGKLIRGRNGKPWKIKIENGYVVRFKLEPSDVHTFRKDDILVSKFDQPDGFQTAWFRVKYVLSDQEVVVTPCNGYAPQVAMSVARQGNFTDTTRQNSIYIDGRNGYIRVLSGVNAPEIRFENIRCQYGNLNGLTVPGMGSLHGYGEYSDNAYKRGVFLMQGGQKVEDFVKEAIEALQGSLGSLAFKDKVEKALLGNTIISGGLIKSELIAVDDALVERLIASEAFIESFASNKAFIAKLAANEAFINNLVARRLLAKNTNSSRAVEINPNYFSFEIRNHKNIGVVQIDDGSFININNNFIPSITVNDPNGAWRYARLTHEGLEVTSEASFTKDSILLPRGSKVNIPGVLAAYDISAGGNIDYRWGAKSASTPTYRDSVGIITVFHNINHLNYIPQVTLKDTDRHWFGTWKVIKKGTWSVTIATGDLGSRYVNMGFYLTLVGDN